MKDIGKLVVYCGGMFAEKSTSLIRQAKRHRMAGDNVIILKPEIDNRYGDDSICTHDGTKVLAKNVVFDSFTNTVDSFHLWQEVKEVSVVCIDEVQFFPQNILAKIEHLIYSGKTVYVSGLDMDKTGMPFETMMILMGRAEEVHKLQAVCRDCGVDAWVTVETVKQEGRVNIGNAYKPVCRACSTRYIGGAGK